MKQLKGILTTLVTPFRSDYAIDEQKFRDLIDFQLENGVHGFVISGSVGEAALMSLDERKHLFEIAVDYIEGKVPVFCGVSCVSTLDAVELSRFSKDIGADGVMAVSSFYYRLADDDIYNYFSEIASVGLPVILYNNPSTSKVDVSNDLIEKLVTDCSNIQYVKDSTGDFKRTRELIDGANGRYRILCGTDDLAYESFVAGADGWVSGIANVIPKPCVDLYNIVRVKQDFKEGLILNSRLHQIFSLGEKRNFVQYLKEGLKIVGLDVGPARKPLMPLNKNDYRELQNALRAFDVSLITAVAPNHSNR